MSITVCGGTVVKIRVDSGYLNGTSVRVEAGRGGSGTYSRMAEGSEGRTGVVLVVKVGVGREVNVMVRVWAKVDLHDHGRNYYKMGMEAGCWL